MKTKIIQSILNQDDFVLKITDDDYFDPRLENAQQIQQEFDQDNKDFVQTVLEIIKVDLAAAEDAKEKKREGILDAAADLPPDNTIIDKDIKTDKIFIDDNALFDQKNIK